MFQFRSYFRYKSFKNVSKKLMCWIIKKLLIFKFSCSAQLQQCRGRIADKYSKVCKFKPGHKLVFLLVKKESLNLYPGKIKQQNLHKTKYFFLLPSGIEPQTSSERHLIYKHIKSIKSLRVGNFGVKIKFFFKYFGGHLGVQRSLRVCSVYF